MRKVLVFIGIMWSEFNLLGQCTIITQPEFYKFEGIVFSEDLARTNKISNLHKEFTPSNEDIYRFEKEFKSLHFKCDQKKFTFYARQYIGGYINGTDEKILLIIFMNYKSNKLKKKFEASNRSSVQLGTGEIYEENVFYQLYYLKTGSVGSSFPENSDRH
jgi:hypothetical protein